VLFSKVPASRITTSDTELFIIRLEVSKTTSMNIEYIIIITNSLGSTKKIVDFLVHSEQAYFLAICSILGSFFWVVLVIKLNSRIVQTRLSSLFTKIVYNDVTNTRVAARLHLITSINIFCFKSVTSCLDTWRTFFNYLTI